MLVFDQLKKDDPQLRFLAVIVFSGLCLLLAGLWWVQLISTSYYRGKLETQSIRTVRIPAVRGKILDREGRPLAENRPSYNVDLCLEDLSAKFRTAYSNALAVVSTNTSLQIAAREKQLGRELTKVEKKQFALTEANKERLKEQMRYAVASNLLADFSARMQEPITMSEADFRNRYDKSRALPLPIMADGLNPMQLARYEEQSAAAPGMDLEVQCLRYYPNGPVAAHLLGYLAHDYKDNDGKTSKYNYWLTDFKGESGIEGLYDDDLHGAAGEKAVVVNNLGYRQSETIETPPEPGRNLVLTIDLDIQKAADAALQKAQANVRGAVVVMDAQNGDVLAMASAPTYDPNHFIVRPDAATREEERARWLDEDLGLQRNRAIYENYHPGSIFKIVVAMAALEQNAFDPRTNFTSLGYFMVGRHKIGDTAKAGEFDFNRAMAKSSNPYFCDLGLRPGVLQKIIVIGERLHLGEKTDIVPHQEARGNFPNLQRISSDWRDGDTANLSIGQGELDVTPIQMAVMTAAVANGGKVFWPRLVSRIENPDGTVVENFPQGRVRDHLGVSARTLNIVHEGMLADTEDPEGTGHLLKIPGWRVPGKTGTAQVERNGRTHDVSAQDTWFVSFAPEENPRYVVVATVEGGASGGHTCVPIAHDVYLALQKREQQHNLVAAQNKMLSAQTTERPPTVDVLQLLAVLGLMVISIAFVYSATMANESTNLLAWYRQGYFKQIIWFGLGFVAAGAICSMDYHALARWSIVAYGLSICTLIAVLIPKIGTMVYGARRWISLGGFQFQPSEFAKLASILALAHFLSRPVDELRQRRNFWKALGLILLPFLLIMKEPDLGSALVLLPTGLAMIYAAGTPRRYILQLLTFGGLLAALFLGDILFAPPRFRIKMQEYQIRRLLVYSGRNYVAYAPTGANPVEKQKLKEEQYKDEYNVKQSLISVGSGGLLGKGWGQGRQNTLGFLPQAGKHNDFIFSVIAEEAGFVGSVVVLTLYSVILFTGIRIAGQARDRLGKLLAVGVVTLLFSHVFINIGMNIRIMPVTGVPLPLLSYGGSSVLGSLIAMGMLQNVYMYRKAY